MARVKKEWPKLYVAKGNEYHMTINAVDEEGNPIEIKNPDGTSIYIQNTDGVYEKKYVKKSIVLTFYKKFENMVRYCHIIVDEPKTGREKYIYSEIEKRVKSGVFMTKDQFEEYLNPEKKITRDLSTQKQDLEDENDTLKKQIQEMSKKLSQYEVKKVDKNASTSV